MTVTQQPLAGVTVLDLSHVYAAPYTTHLLAQAGARVIKIEPPAGEHLRRRGVVEGPRYAFALLNGNKECVTLDLKEPAGIAALKQLVAEADVLVENFRPGVMDRLGVGWSVLREINPGLVYAQSSGYGSTGPYADYPAMDLTVQAMAGIVSGTGHPENDPVKAGAAVCDFTAGIHLYGALMTALFRRERTGVGSRVEVSMLESVFPMLMSSLADYLSSGREGQRVGNRHPGLSVAPYSVYPTADGHVAITCEGDHHWRSLAVLMGRPELQDDPEYAGVKARVANMDDVDAIVGEWTLTRGKDDLVDTLLGAGIPAAPVRTLSEVATDPHLVGRGYLRRIQHPDLGEMTAMGTPLVFDDAPRIEPEPNRRLGQDNEQVMRDVLGLSPAEYQDLCDQGAFGPAGS